MADQPLRVLFLCTGNSARSQMAEALLRLLSNERIDVYSAGSVPAADVHPVAKAILEERYSIDTTQLRPKSIDRFLDRRFDYVVTLCDRAEGMCPVFPGDPERLHWNFGDPAVVQGEAEQRRAFESVAAELSSRLRTWLLETSLKFEV